MFVFICFVLIPIAVGCLAVTLRVSFLFVVLLFLWLLFSVLVVVYAYLEFCALRLYLVCYWLLLVYCGGFCFGLLCWLFVNFVCDLGLRLCLVVVFSWVLCFAFDGFAVFSGLMFASACLSVFGLCSLLGI